MVLLVLVISGATSYIVGPVFKAMTGVYVALVRLLL
jgi:hypothetical protein